jgi:threonine dehydratase
MCAMDRLSLLLTPGHLSPSLLACVSSGNHAAALALAAKLRGIPAYIVVPNNAPACKLAAVKEYGGEQGRGFEQEVCPHKSEEVQQQ